MCNYFYSLMDKPIEKCNSFYTLIQKNTETYNYFYSLMRKTAKIAVVSIVLNSKNYCYFYSLNNKNSSYFCTLEQQKQQLFLLFRIVKIEIALVVLNSKNNNTNMLITFIVLDRRFNFFYSFMTTKITRIFMPLILQFTAPNYKNV